jgi:hypothetical protein
LAVSKDRSKVTVVGDTMRVGNVPTIDLDKIISRSKTITQLIELAKAMKPLGLQDEDAKEIMCAQQVVMVGINELKRRKIQGK